MADNTTDTGAAAAKQKVAHSSTFLSPEQVSTKRQKSEGQLPGLSDVAPLVERMSRKELDRTCRVCHSANNNNKIYCYKCLLPVGKPEENMLPQVKLPIKLDILRHPRELRTKSTALHAGIICGQEDVRIVELPDVDKLTGINPETTVLLFPTADSKTLEELPDLEKVERVVVVDSTWQQANAVLRSDLCQKLTRHVKLAQTHETSFWRHQNKGSDHLATIEAIYYFFRERQEAMQKEAEYDGRFDNMLYIFVGMLRVIEKAKHVEDAKAKPDEKES